jgi:hypothetical protein
MISSDRTCSAGRGMGLRDGTCKPSANICLLAILLAPLPLGISGCDSNRSARNWSETGLVCRVRIDGQSVVGVQVHLLPVDPNEPTLGRLLGLTDTSGRIALKKAPPNPLSSLGHAELGPIGEYLVGVESLGDGNWEITPPFNDPSTSPLRINGSDWQKQTDGTHEAVIDLPRRAIRKIGR